MANGFLGVVKDFISKQEETKDQANLTQEQMDMAKKYMGMADDFINKGKEWNFCGGNRSGWGEKRAVIVKKPEEVIVGEPGSIVIAEVEVENQTKWPWRNGCFLG